jgi:hypothetical protein
MSLSKKWCSPENIQAVLELYRSPEAPTLTEISKQLGATIQTVNGILLRYMPHAEHNALKKLRYSRSKTGEKNPFYKRKGKAHPRWIGMVEDGYGYQTYLSNGKREFVHRMVMAKALGLEKLPRMLEVHHIDGNGMNNDLNNLALVTSQGHKSIHLLQRTDSIAIRLKKSSLWDAFQYTTLQSQETKAT